MTSFNGRLLGIIRELNGWESSTTETGRSGMIVLQTILCIFPEFFAFPELPEHSSKRLVLD